MHSRTHPPLLQRRSTRALAATLLVLTVLLRDSEPAAAAAASSGLRSRRAQMGKPPLVPPRPPPRPMSVERARACLDALAHLPASALWHVPSPRPDSSNATGAAGPPLSAAEVELRIEGCPFLTRAEALVALAGEHLLLIGDSLSRYHYLNLVYWLLVGGAPGLGRDNGLSDAGDFDAARGGPLLHGREVCDCATWGTAEPHNRYFFLPEARLRVSYLQWREGSLPLSGHEHDWLGLDCFERWHERESARDTAAVADAAEWLDDAGGFFSSRLHNRDSGGSALARTSPSPPPPLQCEQQGCARRALDGRCNNETAPLQWRAEPPLAFEQRARLLRPTTVVLGTFAWRPWSDAERGPLPAALERIVRASSSVRRVLWRAATPDQVISGMSRDAINKTFGEKRLEENVDRAAVNSVVSAAANAGNDKPASRFGVFDSSLICVPLVRLARERHDVHALWTDHVHFRPPVFHALNMALVTQIAALNAMLLAQRAATARAAAQVQAAAADATVSAVATGTGSNAVAVAGAPAPAGSRTNEARLVDVGNSR
jgi:hypothetical protein